MADTEGVAASFEEVLLPETFYLVAGVPKRTSPEFRTRYGPMSHVRFFFQEWDQMAEVRLWLIIAARGMTQILATGSDAGRRRASLVWVHFARPGRLICRSSVKLTRLCMYVVCTLCFGGTTWI